MSSPPAPRVVREEDLDPKDPSADTAAAFFSTRELRRLSTNDDRAPLLRPVREDRWKEDRKRRLLRCLNNCTRIFTVSWSRPTGLASCICLRKPVNSSLSASVAFPLASLATATCSAAVWICAPYL